MAHAFPPTNKDKRILSSAPEDDDGFDNDLNPDVIELLQENARLRALVTQLSSLVLKHVADQK
jgi:hypothetical protein